MDVLYSLVLEKCYYELLGRLLYDLTAWKHSDQLYKQVRSLYQRHKLAYLGEKHTEGSDVAKKKQEKYKRKGDIFT